MSNQKILVTGAAGFIAFHLIESFLRDQIPVIGIDNFDPFYDINLKRKNLEELTAIALKTGTSFDFFEKDFGDPGFERDFHVRGVTAVVHLGAKAGVRPSILDPQGYIKANINGTQALLDWSVTNDVKTFVFGSSSSVYGNTSVVPFSEAERCDQPISPYAMTKRAGELMCSTYAHLNKMKISCLRFFTVYGPKQRPDLAIRQFTGKISRGEPIRLFGDGSTARDYTFVTDIVKGIRQNLDFTHNQRDGYFDIFNIGGSQTTTLIDLIRKLEKNIGVAAKVEWAPMQPGDVDKTFADVSKSKKMFGYNPQVSIDSGLHDFVLWFKNKQKIC